MTAQTPTLDLPPLIQPEQQPQPVWPDGVPSVSVDIEAGKLYQSLDVDPNQLSELLANLGIAEQDQDRMSLLLRNHFEGRERTGVADFETNSVEALLRTDEKTNKTLTHEFKHMKDNLSGEIVADKHWGIRKFVRTVRRLGMVAAPNVLMGIYAGSDTPTGKIGLASAAISASMMYKNATYRSDPSERRAYAAQRNRKLTHTIVSTIPR